MKNHCTHCDADLADHPVTVTPTNPTDGHKLILKIENMDCPTEEALIRKALGAQPGIDDLGFDLINRTLTIVHRLDDFAPILAVLAGIGMRAEPIAHEETKEQPSDKQQGEPRSISRQKWALMTIAGLAAISSEIFAYIIGNETSWPVAVLALLAIATCGLPTLKKGWIALKTFTLNINLLMSVAVLGAVAIGQWPEAAVVIWLFGIAELIEAASLDRARNAIRDLMALAPDKATVRQADDSWVEVDAATVPLGAIVRVRPSERIALDGVVVNGESSVNQAPITGESMPVDKKVGDALFAGTINERGVLEFRVTAAKGETTLDRIARSVQEAQSQRAPTQRFVDQFARIYTPAVFLIALLVALVPSLVFGQPWLEWIYRALVLLVIACPCALVISTPVTVVSGLTAAARRGIVIKGGLYLEQGHRLKAIALDKTGTLTYGNPTLTNVVPIDGFSEDETLRIAASLDALSEHPVAVAIAAGYTDKAYATVADFEALPGRGVKGIIDGTQYYIGNHHLIEELQVCSPALEEILDRLEAEAKTAVVLTTSERALAVLAVADAIRPSSTAVVTELKSLGITPVMLTGDNEKTARAVAAQVGIDDARGNLLPEDKLAVIGTLLTQHGPTGMVGDGVNDAPALAKADIGFAMGGAGTDTAIETADVALMQDDLHKLPEFIRLSHKTARVLWQNIGIALGVKVVFFALTLTGHGTLWMAVFADMGASLIVVANGLRLLDSSFKKA